MTQKSESLIKAYSKAKRVSEKDFQNRVLQYLNEHKVWHYRTQMGMQAGLPDIIAIVNGMFVGIELKREDGKGRATLQQEKVIADIRSAGGVAAIISGMEDLETLLWCARNTRTIPPVVREFVASVNDWDLVEDYD